jgi:hypothetical protein
MRIMASFARSARLLVALGAGLLAVSPLAAVTGPADAATVTHTTWVTHALAPAKSTGLTRNEDGEPGIGVSPSGQFWVASDIAPYAAHDPRIDPVAGLLSGADIWSSSDGGRTYRWHADPFSLAQNTAGLAGEDTDLAVAPQKNAQGFYNVYAASLWVGSSSVASSQDGGKTWNVNPLGGVPTQDRPWLAADGPCTLYVAYHELPAFTPTISTYDVCTNANVPVSNGAALDPVHSTNLTLSDFPGLSNSFNKQAVDTSPSSPHRHALYVPMSLCKVDQFPDVIVNANSSSCPKGTQYLVAVSTDGGQTFTYHPVALDPSGASLVWTGTVNTDGAGTVYFAWSDEKNSYLDVSRDGGKTWTKPKKLNAPNTAAVYPTVAGGKAGRVDIAWYGTTRPGDANNTKVMGKPNASGSAKWTVQLARSTDSGRTFTRRTVSGVIHRGELCTHGSGCADTDARNLLDDFGVAISPTTGRTSIAFTDDQPEGQAGTAYTAYASEVPVTTTSASSSSGSSTSSSGRTSSSGALARTGGSLVPAATGVALIGCALLVRRRRAV